MSGIADMAESLPDLPVELELFGPLDDLESLREEKKNFLEERSKKAAKPSIELYEMLIKITEEMKNHLAEERESLVVKKSQ